MEGRGVDLDGYWSEPRDFNGDRPQSLNEMRASAHAVIAREWLSSAAEVGMARCILWLLDEIARNRSEPSG